MVSLHTISLSDRERFWNVNQKYLYEMTQFYENPMDENGNVHYGYFEQYFTDPRRVAYFILSEDTVVGFAMICPYSNIGRNPDFTMAEFTVFPAYRRHHYAIDAANMILRKHPGQWEIKYHEKNAPAKKLWTRVTAPYSPEIVHVNENETVFAFDNSGASNKSSIEQPIPRDSL